MATSKDGLAQQTAALARGVAAPTLAPVGMAAFAALALGALLYPAVQNLAQWPMTVALRHAAAAPSCAAARAVGLAPAWRGQPGTCPQHDADRDGIACEPWPRR